MPGATVSQSTTYHGTLTAATVDKVTITNPNATLTVTNRVGATSGAQNEIYFTVTGVTPTVGGTGNTAGDMVYVLPNITSALAVRIPQPVFGTYAMVKAGQTGATGNPGCLVQLISTGSPNYSVELI